MPEATPIEEQGSSAYMDATVWRTGARLGQAVGALLQTGWDERAGHQRRPATPPDAGGDRSGKARRHSLEHRRHAAQRRVGNVDLKNGLHA